MTAMSQFDLSKSEHSERVEEIAPLTFHDKITTMYIKSF